MTALKLSERENAPATLAFGWQRARVLGAFFNGVFLLALGVSIFVQSIERFIYPEHIDEPILMLIMGCVGVGTNLICILLVHEHHDHDHKPHAHSESPVLPVDLADIEAGLQAAPVSRSRKRDLGINAVLVHILGDILNNLGVIAAALILIHVKSPYRFYADPALSMAIAIMISASAFPLTCKSGHILLGSAPPDLKLAELTQALIAIPGVLSIHELRVWRLNQEETIGSAHIVVSPLSSANNSPRLLPIMPLTSRRRSSESRIAVEEQRRLMGAAKTSNERLRRIRLVFTTFGIRSMTLQIEDHPLDELEVEGIGPAGSVDVAKSCHVEVSSV